MNHNTSILKWIIGGFSFLVIWSGLCYLWYQHTTAPYRAELDEMTIRQSENQRTATTVNDSEQAADVSVESRTLTTEKSITDTTNEVVKDEGAIQAQNDVPAETAQKAQTAETTEVRMSPYGFGAISRCARRLSKRSRLDST